MKNKKRIIGVAALAVILVLAAVLYGVFHQKPEEGSKNVTIEVVDSQGTSKTYEVKTDAEYLQQAMEEAKGLEFTGSESTYGFVVETVNGESAVYDADGAYWAFYVNEEYCNYGISQQPVADGDAFQIIYTPA